MRPAASPHWAARTTQLRAILASISENKDLVRRLNQDEVKVDNIVDAEQNADGSVTFFVR